MFGFFYYSEMQARILWNTWERPRFKTFARQIVTGKVVEYTEWTTKPRPAGKWDDYKLVAVGWYDHAEKQD
jgi:hypothetical protein